MKTRFFAIFALWLPLLLCFSAAGQNTPGTLNYPTTLDNADTLFRTADNTQSALAATINSNATSLSLVSGTSFPSSGAVVVENEIIFYTGKSGNTLTGLVRGSNGTSAIAHLIGRSVRGAIFSAQHNTQSQAIIRLQTKLGIGNSTPATNSFFVGSGAGTSIWRALVGSDIPNLDAGKITTGTLNSARLGSGTANAETVLHGDGTWKTPSNSSGGSSPTAYALRFDQSQGHNVYAGQFWKTGVVYHEFFIDALVNAEQSAQYIFSAGYGAWHNILFGFNGGDGSTIALTGNIANEAGSGSFTSVSSGVDRIPLGTWANVALGYYNGYLTVYVNGIPCKKFVKTDGRKSLQAFEVDAYIGGSDHSNFQGLIQWLRIFDNQNPIHRDYSSNEVYKPELRPRTVYASPTVNTPYRANLLLDFSTPALIIDDKSDGFEGARHPGILNYQTGSAVLAESRNSRNNLPVWDTVNIARPQTTLTPATVPAGALIFDSFNRNDVNYLWDDTLGLGSTEGGSLGAQAWQNSDKYGIFSGRVFSASGGGAFPNVNAGTAFIKTTLSNIGNETNVTSIYSSYDTATQTGIFGYHDNGGAFYFYKSVNGSLSGLGSYTVSNTTTYTVSLEYTPNKHIKLWINGAVVQDVNDSANPTLTGTRSGFGTTSGFNRIDDFTVQPSAN